MADNRQIGIDIFIDSKNAANSLGELKRSIKDLKNEALNFEQGSAEFNKLTAAAGQLNDKIADINGTVKVLSGNTTENLTRSFSGVAQAGVGGFQAIIGAQALFGDKNEDLQKQLVKLQGVMNFAAGLREFANLGQAVKDFKTVVSSLIPTVVTKTAVTEADTAVQQQNTFSLIASGVASAALAVKNGILSASTVVVTGLTEAFGITATAAWAAATLGVSLLITGIIALVAYWDDINAKVEEFGVAGKIAFGLILGPIGAVYQGIVAIGEALGLLDDETEKSAERRAEAEAKYKDSIESSNKSIGDSRRAILVATGKISEEQAKREKLKEDFLTNYLKAQEEIRTQILEENTKEKKAAAKAAGDLRLKALQEEYTKDLVLLNKSEKDKQAAKDKSDADSRKAASDKAKAAREKQAADDLKDTEAFNQKLKQTQLIFATEEEKINEDTKRKIAEFDKAFADLTAEERKNRQSEYLSGLLDLELEGQKKINDLKSAEEEKRKAKEKEDQEKEKQKSDDFLSTLVSNADARLSAEEAITNEGNNRKRELQAQFDALSAEEQILRKKQFDDEILAINAETNKKLEDQQKETAEKQEQIRQAGRQLAINQAQQLGSALISIGSSLSEFGKKSEKQKVKDQRNVALAGISLSTGLGIAQAVSDGMKVGITPIEKGIAIAGGIALVLANIAKARQTVKQADEAIRKLGESTPPPPDLNVSSGGGAGAGGAGGGGGPIAPPSFNIQGQQIGGAGGFVGGSGQPLANQPIRVFVTESDITNTQNQVQVVQGNSLFGGKG